MKIAAALSLPAAGYVLWLGKGNSRAAALVIKSCVSSYNVELFPNFDGTMRGSLFHSEAVVARSLYIQFIYLSAFHGID